MPDSCRARAATLPRLIGQEGSVLMVAAKRPIGKQINRAMGVEAATADWLVQTHQIRSNTLTVVSLARAVTRFTTSTRMEDRRKRDTISAEHCCIDEHPAWKKYCRIKYQAVLEPSPDLPAEG